MDRIKTHFLYELRKSLDKPLDGRTAELIPEIERRPQLFLGSDDVNILCLFHFLNGWQAARFEDLGPSQASLNERMNAFLALKYNDFDSLSWKDLLIRHEGEDAAFGRFFEYFHMAAGR